jgi:protein-tyrosine phosphatase
VGSQEFKTINNADNFKNLLKQIDKKTPQKKCDRASFIKKLKLKKIIYLVSLVYNLLKNKFLPGHPWWSKITDNLYLGAIPLEIHRKELLVLGIESVVSVVEEFEKLPSIVGTPITKSKWQEHNVSNIEISFPDFAQVPTEKLYESALAIKKAIDKGYRCYVHCKAGRGRSAAAIVSYLCLFKDFTPQEALDLVKEKRHFIDLSNKFFMIELLWQTHQKFKP